MEWRSWLRPGVFFVYFILLCVALPLSVWELHKNDAQTHVQAWFIAGCFVFMTVPIALWGIVQHMVNYNKPELQRRIVRILWMVPIYSLDSWMALRFPKLAIYFDSLRECYEAYVIYSFITYLMSYLSTECDLDIVMMGKPPIGHMFPFCVFPPWKMNRKFIHRCKQGVMSYAVVRVLMTFIAFCTELAGKYDEGNFSFKSAWTYIVIVNNCSQVWALYCLVLFYRALKHELSPLEPFGKFLCIKLIVFASFWQGALIAVLVKVGVISESHTWVFYTVEDVSNGIQNFIICVEMLIFAVAHYYVFSHKPYLDTNSPPPPCCASLVSMCDITDVRDDVVEHVRHVGSTVRGTVVRNKRTTLGSGDRSKEPNLSPDSAENTPLLESPGSLHGSFSNAEHDEEFKQS